MSGLRGEQVFTSSIGKVGSGFRAVGAVLLAVVLAFGMAPMGSAHAANDLAAATLTSASVSETQSQSFTTTSNAWAHDYTVNGRPALSYLHITPQGTLERVEYIKPNIVVEAISPDLKSVVSSKTLSSDTFSPSGATKVLFGTFFSGSNHNYVVTGQPNESESDDVATYRIVKYTKDWQYVAHVELYGANTYLPFYGGNCDCSEYAGKLIVRTCRKMYDVDGFRHQANSTFVIDEDSMQVLDKEIYVSNITSYYGYVSHSFNQTICSSRLA